MTAGKLESVVEYELELQVAPDEEAMVQHLHRQLSTRMAETK